MKKLTITITDDDERTSLNIKNEGFNPLEQIGWAEILLADRIKEFQNAYIPKVTRKLKPRKNETETDKA